MAERLPVKKATVAWYPIVAYTNLHQRYLVFFLYSDPNIQNWVLTESRP